MSNDCWGAFVRQILLKEEGRDMAGKDIAEKSLEAYNDVFADIVNEKAF